MSDKDTIYRHEAIEAIEHITSSMSVCVNTDECHGMKRMQRQAVIELANLPSVQPEQQWTPSGEKPPKEGSYLVWMPFAPPKHRMAVAEYCGGYWNIKTPISAWMPLPEPYKGE